MDKRQKGPAQFVVARRKTAKLFEMVEKSFHFLA
jgi:hypothetical protein